MQTISREQLRQMLDDNRKLVLIETLPEESFRKEHLPGAVNVPVDDPKFEKKVHDAIPEKDSDVVVYCADKACPASPKAAHKLEQLGFTSVFDYENGKADWKDAGLELTH